MIKLLTNEFLIICGPSQGCLCVSGCPLFVLPSPPSLPLSLPAGHAWRDRSGSSNYRTIVLGVFPLYGGAVQVSKAL